ncbi:MAG: PAS domain-containing protein, partial [Pseudomonas caspiana]
MPQNIADEAFEHAPLPLLIIDPPADRLIKANRAALALLGCAETNLGDKRFSHFLGDGLPHWVTFTDETLTQGSAWSDDLSLLDISR